MEKEHVSCSLLMSLYNKEIPSNLSEALDSIIMSTVYPMECIIVEDGTLTDQLLNILDTFEKSAPFKVIRIKNETNLGLGKSLNKGLKYCSQPYIMRFDTDDINKPERIATQYQFMIDYNLDLSSTPVEEFSGNETKSIKDIPKDEKDILKYAKHRNPMNHMSVCFRKEAVIAVGSYEDVPYFEDYYLWLKMFANHCKVKNFSEPLVKARVDDSFYMRRGGIQYFKKELYFQRKIYKEKFINFFDYILNLLSRTFVRLLPKYFLNKIYKFLRNKI